MASTMTTRELQPIAEAIYAHLKRFEADPEVNAPRERGGMTTTPYFNAFAVADRKRVVVQYISYQGQTRLTADEAVAYLTWLDAGNVGKHPEALRS